MQPLIIAAVCILSQGGTGAGYVAGDQIAIAVRRECLGQAQGIARAGGFRGFKASPGSSMKGSDSLRDFLVQNVAVDARDHPTAENPLNVEKQRDYRSGEKLPYVLCDYPRAGEPVQSSALQHRYAIPFVEGGDQTGAKYPIILGVRDLTPDKRSSEHGTLGPRDIASVIGIFPGFGCYMGAFIPKKEGYAVSVGPGYAEDATEGMARFAHALYPDPVPEPGSMWYATVLQKTISVGREEAVKKFPSHGQRLLVPQLTIGKRMNVVYGTRERKVGPLDSVVVVLAYNNVNALGNAPQIDNRSRQVERIYLTKELGYATRWESWAREDREGKPEEVLQEARRAYAYDDCGKPADLSGKFSEHFFLGQVVDDGEAGVYKQEQIIIDPATGRTETKIWYLVGCHDYTNLQPQTPADPALIANPNAIGMPFLKLFGVDSL